MNDQPSGAAAYYEPLGDGRYRSTRHAQGAWSADHQHMAPVSALLVSELEMLAGAEHLALSRVTFDILGTIAAGEVHVAARVLRPGRTIELLEAEMTIGGRPAVRATAWRLATSATSNVAASGIPSIAGPDAASAVDLAALWPGGYIRSVEARLIGMSLPGRATVWLRPLVEVVAGRPTSALGRMFSTIDTANGVSVRARPEELTFPNVDLTVHLFRRPVGEWLGLQTEVSFGPDGIGLTAAALHDVAGPIGRSAQTLTLRLNR